MTDLRPLIHELKARADDHAPLRHGGEGRPMKTRRPLDFYPTPQWATRQLLSVLPVQPGQAAFEPCVGEGDIAGPLADAGLKVTTNDIDLMRTSHFHRDAAEPWLGAWELDWVVSNPPFSQAPVIVANALRAARVGVAMLLRLSFLEPCENRRGLLTEWADRMSVVIPPERISFTGDGGKDSVTTIWLVWGRTERLVPAVVYLPRRELQAEGSK